MPREKKTIYWPFRISSSSTKKAEEKEKEKLFGRRRARKFCFFFPLTLFLFLAGNNFSHPQLIEIADDYHYFLNQIDFDTSENSSKSRGGPRKSEVLDELPILTN